MDMGVMEVKRGDVFFIKNEASYLKAPCEQGGDRPAVIIQNDIGNKYAQTVIVAYLTSRKKKFLPTHVRVLETPRPSTVLCEQIVTISKDRLGEFLCHISEENMDRIDNAVGISLGLLN